MKNLILHFMLNDDRDKEKTEESVLDSLFSVIGYSAQSLSLHPDEPEKIVRHMRSEYLRLKERRTRR